VTDFFGNGFGEWVQYQSLPLNMTSGGYNCYWPMPFRRSARITIENRSRLPIDAFYYNVDIETHRRLPKDTLYFHSLFGRATTQLGKSLTLLDTVGRGHYVGTVVSMQSLNDRRLWFLEGDEQVYIDGEETPVDHRDRDRGLLLFRLVLQRGDLLRPLPRLHGQRRGGGAHLGVPLAH
jgi:hypothetical protein